MFMTQKKQWARKFLNDGQTMRGEKNPWKQDSILLEDRGSHWFVAMWGGGPSCREWVDEGGWGRCLEAIQGYGGGEQGSVCDIWSRAAAQKCFEGVHTFAEPLSGSQRFGVWCVCVCVPWEPEVHVETRCLSSCLGIHTEWGDPWGSPPNRWDCWDTQMHHNLYPPKNLCTFPLAPSLFCDMFLLLPYFASLSSVCGLIIEQTVCPTKVKQLMVCKRDVYTRDFKK